MTILNKAQFIRSVKNTVLKNIIGDKAQLERDTDGIVKQTVNDMDVYWTGYTEENTGTRVTITPKNVRIRFYTEFPAPNPANPESGFYPYLVYYGMGVHRRSGPRMWLRVAAARWLAIKGIYKYNQGAIYGKGKTRKKNTQGRDFTFGKHAPMMNKKNDLGKRPGLFGRNYQHKAYKYKDQLTSFTTQSGKKIPYSPSELRRREQINYQLKNSRLFGSLAKNKRI
jgi:hypothetical protein